MEHLDLDTLNTLKQVMEDDFSLLVDTFIQDSSDRIASLRQLIEGADADQIRRAAHSFKGSSSNVGALQLSALCAAMEKKALAGNFNGLAADLSQIEIEFAKVEDSLRTFA
ncbi:Hpt domain-containing protein [Cellvibrio sp. pealriver]|uniref:Hpt domain-containing protein n=1 Tax=Cellvibrio sp. pealriver TaxID=1622269 RepID=UPI00066FD4E6|nr:Hpt domain-containing protein [Cellvibrio sp. pealriver]